MAKVNGIMAGLYYSPPYFFIRRNMNGLIFFEDGTVVPFGQITSVRKIAQTANEVINNLLKREREALLRTVSKEELRSIVDRLSSEENEHNSNI